MAKRDTGGIPRNFGAPGFSLESILEECRDRTPEETAAPETAETEPPETAATEPAWEPATRNQTQARHGMNVPGFAFTGM